MSRGLLTYLADRFVVQREDLATEALLFILRKSDAASAEILRILSDLGYIQSGTAVFRSQMRFEGGERPDLVAIVDGRARVLLEAKFWAGLTDHQPITYLDTLEKEGNGALVFVAPYRRLEILWMELERRIRESGRELGALVNPFRGARAATVGEIRLMAVSWNTLLTRIDQALAIEGEGELRESLGQLQTLCRREDTEAFLPITQEELTSSFPRRLEQFGVLVDDAVARIVKAGIADTKGLRAAAGNGWYGRYVHLAGTGCLLHVSSRKWADVESTPIWLRVKDRNWEVSPELRSAFDQAQSAGLFRYYDRGNGLEVPIQVLLGRERAAVLDRITDQMTVAYEVLSGADLPPKRAASPSEIPEDPEEE